MGKAIKTTKVGHCKLSAFLAVSLFLFLMVFTAVAETSVEWSASEIPDRLLDGALVFTYESGAIKTLTVTPVAGETIVISGDAMTFANEAELRMAASGKLVFATDLTGTGRLSVLSTRADETIEYDDSLLYTNAWTTMFTGFDLDAYRPVKSVRRNGSGVYDPYVYFPYNVRRTVVDGRKQLSMQLMSSQGANESAFNTRVLFVRLRQNGSDIEGILDRASYLDGRVALGEDFEQTLTRHAVSPEPSLTPMMEVHTPSYERGYGLRHLLMARTDTPTVEFRGTVAATLVLNVTTCNVRSVGGDILSPVSGDGVITVASGESSAEDPCVDLYENFIAGNQVVVSQNRLLTTLTNVTATITGSYMSGRHFPAIFCCPTGNNLCITGELQVATDIYTWRYVRVEFKQVGMGVRATALEAGYVKTVPASDISGNVGEHSVFEPQFDDIRHALTPIAQSDTGGPTGAFGYKLYYSEPAAQSWTPSSSFRNQMRQGDAVSVNQFGYDAPKFRIEGSSNSRMQVKFSTGYTVPTNSTIEVGDGGELVYDVTDSGSKPTPLSLIRVEKGGKLRIRRSDSLHGRCNVILDGGELSFRDDLISTADTWTTLNLLTFRDGAKACGAAIRFGYSGTARWRVAGNVPSICEAPILLVNLNSGEDICVLDVTGDEAPDFILKGGISSYSGNRSTLHKTGGGTLAHYGACNTGSKISIEDGTWLLTGNASASQDYTLAGGTLGAADGTANAVGVLHVEGGGRIKVGADATLAFADSSSAAWNSSGHILIEGDLANGAVRVGTSSSALTSLQLSRLRYDGKRVKIDENGYLREDANGFKVIIK